MADNAETAESPAPPADPFAGALSHVLAALRRGDIMFAFGVTGLLVALILRPVGFKFRSKLASPRWRTTWDAALFVGGLVPALVFGAGAVEAAWTELGTYWDELLGAVRVATPEPADASSASTWPW